MKQLKLLFTLACMAVAGAANADVIVLDFEGINPSHPHGNDVFVQDFYNGGTASNGTSGTNYGIGFSANAINICLNTESATCSNTSRGGEGNPNSQLSALFFLTGSETFMNVAAGFDTGFSFFYAAPNNAGSVSVFDDLDGTGNLLASFSLPTTPSTCASSFNATFCPFQAVGVAFDGIAKSVSFAGVANQIVIDDVTFGSEIPDPDPVGVPAPVGVLFLGLGVVGLISLRNRK